MIFRMFVTVIFYKLEGSVCNIVHHLLEYEDKVKSSWPSLCESQDKGLLGWDLTATLRV